MGNYNEGGDAFRDRLKALIEQRFEGNVSAFVRKCEDVGGKGALSHGAVIKYLKTTEPGRDKLVVMARALDVPVGWLAAGEGAAPYSRREAPEGRCSGADDALSDIVRRSIHPGTEPERVGTRTYPGVAFEMLGKDVLVVDFVVTGQSDRLRLPLNPKVKSESET